MVFPVDKPSSGAEDSCQRDRTTSETRRAHVDWPAAAFQSAAATAALCITSRSMPTRSLRWNCRSIAGKVGKSGCHTCLSSSASLKVRSPTKTRSHSTPTSAQDASTQATCSHSSALTHGGEAGSRSRRAAACGRGRRSPSRTRPGSCLSWTRRRRRGRRATAGREHARGDPCTGGKGPGTMAAAGGTAAAQTAGMGLRGGVGVTVLPKHWLARQTGKQRSVRKP